MDDRQTFAALCKQPPSILCPENSNSTLCCNDVVEIIRARLCPPRIWGVDILSSKAQFYDIRMRAWSSPTPLQPDYYHSASTITERGWLLLCGSSGNNRIVFTKPGDAPVAVPYRGWLLKSNRLTYANNCVVNMHGGVKKILVETTRVDLDDLAAAHGEIVETPIANVDDVTPMTVVPCVSGALCCWQKNYIPSFRYLDIDSYQVLEPPSGCPIDHYHYRIRTLPVSSGVEFWGSGGPIALYDARERRWQSYEFKARSDQGYTRSVVSIDTDVVACLMAIRLENGAVLEFYDRRAMAFIPEAQTPMTELNLLSLVCL